MSFVLALIAFTLSSAASDFDDWSTGFNKSYSTPQELKTAHQNWLRNQQWVQELNSDLEDTAEYSLDTPFADIDVAAFAKLRFPRVMNPQQGKAGGEWLSLSSSTGAPPASIDWVANGAVTPVKDQGGCGSCWAESAVGNMESAWFLANNGTNKASNPVALSTEEVIECDAYNYACYGGFPKGAYEYAVNSGGLASAKSYPYNVDGHTICLANQTFNQTCGDGMCGDPPLTTWCDLTCNKKAQRVAKFSSWVALPEDEEQLAAHLAFSGPISVGLDAAGKWGVFLPWLQLYKKGVADPKSCRKTLGNIDHAVLLVGYGTDNGVPYWKIKNSWGTKWGEEGYFRLRRGTGACGINLMATSVKV